MTKNNMNEKHINMNKKGISVDDGAESFERRNGSGQRQAYSPRPSNLFKTCLSSLRWKYLMLWLRYQEHLRKRSFEFHCKKGFHQMNRQVRGLSQYVDGKEKVIWNVEYISCGICGTMFFSTVKDKRTYLALESNNRKRQRNAIKYILGDKRVRRKR